MISGKSRLWFRARRVGAHTLVLSIVLGTFQAFPRPAAIDFLPPQLALAETLSNPKFVSAAVMPNGQAALLYANGDNGVGVSAEIRFSGYTGEHALAPSTQLSTAGPAYPQLATFRGRLVAGYVDTRAANLGKFIVRASDDNGVTWSAEAYLFSGETFNAYTHAPRLVASRDGQTLYFFHAAIDTIPQYRSTSDPALAAWSAPAPAGDASMLPAYGNNCGNNICQRAHTFGFMETATAGTWLYVAKAGIQVGRGTQVGALGGSWSLQVSLGGDGGVSGNGDSTATTFLDRDGNVVYVRAGANGEWMYSHRSTDGGLSWGPLISAYLSLPQLVTDAPVGLYVPNYTRGEYVWYAGFGGIENAMRVIPLWTGPPLPYSESGTIRLFGSAGGDLDANSAYEYNFGDAVRSIGGGGYVTGATDLAIPGRLLGTAFTRTYNSANGFDSGPLGPAWTHNYHWWLTDNGAKVTIRRSSGQQDKFTRQLDGSYTKEPGVFDTLVKTGDTAFTLTSRDQTSYDFVAGRLVKIREPAGNQITLGYSSFNLMIIPQGGTASFSASRCCTTGYEPANAANGKISNTAAGGWGWQVGNYLVGDWWKVTWSAAQSLSRVRLWDFAFASDYYGQGHLEFSDSSTVAFGPLPNDAGPVGEDFREVSFPRKSGITWMKVVTDSLGAGYPGLAEVEAYDDESTTPSFISRLNVVTDSVGRRVTLGYAADANLARGRSYEQSILPDAGTDTGGAELTDGLRGDSLYYNDLSWQAHQDLAAPLDVTVDLGSAQAIGPVRSWYYNDPNEAPKRPASVEVLTSTDNSVYTSRGTVLAADSVSDTGTGRRYMYELSANVAARYVRLRITKGGAGSALKSSEIHVAPQGAVQPSATVGERLVSVTDPIGRKVGYGYDSSGRLTRVVDMLGNAAGQDPTLHTWTYAYDGLSNHISAVTDPDGRVLVANTYDSLGRLDTQKDGLLNTTNFDYAGGQVITTDPRLHVTTQTFDARNRLLSQQDTVDAIPYTLSFTYDGCGNRDSATDRRGKTTLYTYDCAGNLRQVVAPSLAPPAPGFETNFDYDPANNNLREIVDARGFVTTNAYDLATNVLLSTTQQITAAPDTFAVTKWEYTDAANPGLATRIISPRGNPTGTPNYTFSQAMSYDASSNLTQVIDADGNKTTFGYDGIGRQTTMVDPDGYAAGGVPSQHTWTTVYDDNDRVTQTIDPLNHSAFSGYDDAGNRTSSTDRNGNVTSYAYDNAARLLNVKQKPDPIGNPTLEYTTSVIRDANGNATQVTQANGVITEYVLDALNRTTSVITHPTGVLQLTTSYVLDGNGNATTRTAGDGVVTNYTYDNMSRLKTVSSTELPQPIEYGYDELSRRTSMIDGTGTSTYVYDGLSRITQAVQPNGTLGYGYDLDSNRTTLAYPTVGNVTYAFSPAGRLSSLTDWGSRQSVYTYSAAGHAKTVTVPGGMTATYTYDNAQRLTALVNSTAGGTITSHTYTLDNEGNRTAIDELMAGGALASVKVNSDTGTAVQDHPAITIGADNASYLIWDDVRDGNANIYFSKRDAATGVWGTNVKVNTDSGTRVQLNPAISLDASSNAYAVWDDFRDATNNQNIYYSKRSAGTGTWSTPNSKVNDGTGNTNERNPRIAGTAAGIETAVWVDLRSGQNNIYSSQLPAGGSVWPPNKKITDNTSALKDFPDVAVDSANTAYAVWQDSRNGNADIFFSTLTNGAGAWAANVKISDDAGTAAQTKPRIGVDAAGNLVAAWIDARTTPAKIRVARKPSGGAWSASIEISPAPASAQSLALSVRADGYAWASWGDTRGTSQDIWGSRYDPYLNAWSVPQRLDDDPGTTAAQLNPAVAFSVAETMLAWRDNRLNANGNTQARRMVFAPGLTDHFALAYDGLNRLKSVSGPVSETFALDQASNIDSRTGPTQDFSYDQANRLTSDGGQTFTWSNADRLAQRGADIFGYDALDRLTSSTVAGTARTYAYNGDGLLRSRTQGTATQFLWDPSSSPSRLLKQGGDHIVYGLGPLYVVKADTTTLTLARDGSKNVRAEVSSAGLATAAFRYRAYGQLAQSTTTGPAYLGLASQLLDPSGLYYMRARWYEPMTGRFITRDPIDGDAGAPMSLNAFAYGYANPNRISDPNGRCPVCAAVVAIYEYSKVTGAIARMAIKTQGDVRTLNGMTVVENVQGPAAAVLGMLDASAMTLGSDFVFSTTRLADDDGNLNDLGRHEILGHGSQGAEMGDLYTPVYLLDWAAAWLVQDYLDSQGWYITLHDAHPMEIDANVRARITPVAGSLRRKGLE